MLGPRIPTEWLTRLLDQVRIPVDRPLGVGIDPASYMQVIAKGAFNLTLDQTAATFNATKHATGGTMLQVHTVCRRRLIARARQMLELVYNAERPEGQIVQEQPKEENTEVIDLSDD